MIRTWNRCFSVAKRKKLPLLTRFGYQTFLLTFLIKIGDIIIDLFHIIIFLAIADPGGFK